MTRKQWTLWLAHCLSQQDQNACDLRMTVAHALADHFAGFTPEAALYEDILERTHESECALFSHPDHPFAPPSVCTCVHTDPGARIRGEDHLIQAPPEPAAEEPASVPTKRKRASK